MAPTRTDREKTRLGPATRAPAGMRLSGNSRFDYRGPLLYIDTSIPDNAVATHELSHFLLHAYMPYGFFLDVLGDLMSSEVLQYAFWCPESRVSYSGLEFARICYEDPDRLNLSTTAVELFEVSNEFAERWSWRRALEQAFEGESLNLSELCGEAGPSRRATPVHAVIAGALSAGVR